MNLLELIEEAFSSRERPKDVTRKGAPRTEEYLDAMSFYGKDWHEISCKDLEDHQDAIFGFSGDAFLYYLPGIYAAGVRENRYNLLIYDSLVYMLDRGNIPNSWDIFFLNRWAKLTKRECEVSQEWLLWLTNFDDISLHPGQISRAYDTLTIISNKNEATPLAGIS